MARRAPARRWRCRPLLAALVALAGAAPVCAAPPAVGEYEAKAAFLFNFTQFAEWPKEALPETATPVVICVFGEDPFGPALDEIVRGETANGHPLVVRRLTLPAAARDCQVLFCGAHEQDHAPELLRTLAGRPVLTVGESTAFLDLGGAIALQVVDARIRFEVNVGAANAAGVKLSSKLLRLAANLRDGGAR